MGLPTDQMQAFLDSAPDAMVIVDAKGHIVFANTGAEAMFRYERAELVGKPVEVLLPERFRGRHADHVLDYSAAPRRRPMGSGIDLYAQRRDGTEFPVEISLSPVATAHGNFVSSAIRDITDRKAVERKLTEARDFAEQASRAKSAFLAAASHDLRQPLQTLTLLTSALSRIVPSHSKAASAIASQSEALHSMADLLNSLLDISKLEAGAIKPDISDCSVKTIFARLRAEFAVLAEAKGLELIVEDCDEIIRTDPTLLGRVIQNLLGNALRYTRAGWIRLRALVAPDIVRIEVLDSGIGIPPEELDLIFDEYYQTSHDSEEARLGIGLGLSIARRVSNLLGCDLEVESAVDRGSCFAISVPRAVSGVSRSRTTAARGIHVPEGATVLVVDDDAAVGDATAMLLRTAGLEVIVATDTERALQAILDDRKFPNLMICDYHLGHGATGADAIRTIREACELSLPAILISGDTSSAVTETLSGLEMCRWLSKPVDPDNLLELIAQSLTEDQEGVKRRSDPRTR